MSTSTNHKSSLQIRPLQYRDLNAIAFLLQERLDLEYKSYHDSLLRKIRKYQSYFGLLQLSHIFADSFCQNLYLYIAEKDGQIHGFIEVSPVNYNRTTWKVEQVLVNHNTSLNHLLIGNCSIGSQLLRYCFEKIWEARTWILEVNINEKNTIGLYRENGFQPIEQVTYWECNSNVLETLSQQDISLPNLLPVSNADSRLIYQLDCVCMPPMLRQIFDRHIEDFKRGIWQYFREQLQGWLNQIDTVRAYVVEPQRKAAIGYFQLEICKNGSQPHQANFLVHPAYTWLYPKLLSKMAELVKPFPDQSLIVSSCNYQAEREEYLVNLGAERKSHNLFMSRSVWHKLKETKTLDLSLPEVLKGLKPAHNPIPTPWTKSYWTDNSHPSTRSQSADDPQASD
jgi:hypothetical protein